MADSVSLLMRWMSGDECSHTLIHVQKSDRISLRKLVINCNQDWKWDFSQVLLAQVERKEPVNLSD